MTRKHIHEEEFPIAADKLFAMLHTPSAICEWWGASNAIVIPENDGVWTAAWGVEPDAPDYISSFKIAAFEPPNRMLLVDGKYFAREGRPPFEARMTTEFTVEASVGGCKLRVVQDGFPAHPIADDFYAACETGWKNTFAGIRKYLSKVAKLS